MMEGCGLPALTPDDRPGRAAAGRSLAAGRPRRRGLSGRSAAGHRAVPRGPDGPAAAARGSARRRQDRGDDEFEAFLFEVLAESAVTIPELGTLRAAFPPVVVLTSNRTRDLHDALKRRCLYHWIDYPGVERVAAIIRRRVPAAATPLAGQVADGVARLRGLDLAKPPGVAAAISWTAARPMLGAEKLDEDVAEQTAVAVLKYAEDLRAE